MSDPNNNNADEAEGAYTDEEQKDGTRTVAHTDHDDEHDGKYTDSDVAEPAEPAEPASGA